MGRFFYDCGIVLDNSASFVRIGLACFLADFALQFLLSSGEILDGIVQLGPLPQRVLPGDCDHSGVVDLDDYTEWRAIWRIAATWQRCRRQWKWHRGRLTRCFGETAFSALAVESLAVPEPSAVWLTAVLEA